MMKQYYNNLNTHKISKIIIFLVYLIGLWILHQPILESSHKFINGDLGDSRLVSLFLEHSHQFFTGREGLSFWSPWWSFYPYPNTLSFSETMAGSVPVYSIFRLIEFGAQESYQLWLLAVSSLNFWFFYAFLKKNRLGSISSSTGAFLFSFSLPVSGLLFHTQLMPRFYIPMGLYFFTCYVQSVSDIKRLLYLSGFYIATALQIWASAYIGWFFCFIMVSCILLMVFFPKSLKIFLSHLKDFRAHLLGVCIFVLILLPLGLQYNNHTMPRSYSEVAASLPSIATYFKSHGMSYFYNPEHFTFGTSFIYFGNGASSAFSGFFVFFLLILSVPIAILIASGRVYLGKSFSIVWLENESRVLFWIAFFGGLFVFLVSLNFMGESLWQLVYDYFPGAKRLRVINRIVLLLLVFQGILVSLILTQWENGSLLKKMIPVLFLIAIVTENYAIPRHNYSKKDHYHRISQLVGTLRKNKHCDMFYYSRRKEVQVISHIDAMWASLETGVPTVNGYSGRNPLGWTFWTTANQKSILLWLKKNNKGSKDSICIIRG